MSSEQRKGTLKEPTSMQSDEEVPMVRDEVRIDQNLMRQTACSVLTEVMDFEINKWVMVSYEDEVFPGIVKKVFDGMVRVGCMEYDIPSRNCFRWPLVIDELDYKYDDVICKIDAPEITGVSAKNKRRDVYAVLESDYEEACKFIKE